MIHSEIHSAELRHSHRLTLLQCNILMVLPLHGCVKQQQLVQIEEQRAALQAQAAGEAGTSRTEAGMIEQLQVEADALKRECEKLDKTAASEQKAVDLLMDRKAQLELDMSELEKAVESAHTDTVCSHANKMQTKRNRNGLSEYCNIRCLNNIE
jgi:uncharacterized protein HemX